jgi:hypothetical protein
VKAKRLAGSAKRRGGRHKGNAEATAAKASPLEAAQQVKALVDMYRVKTVRGLADLFGKA